MVAEKTGARMLPGIDVEAAPLAGPVSHALDVLQEEHSRVVGEFVAEMTRQFECLKSGVRRLAQEGVVDAMVIRKRLQALDSHLDMEPIIEAMVGSAVGKGKMVKLGKGPAPLVRPASD